MKHLFDGLEKFGLQGFQDFTLFQSEKKEQEKNNAAVEKKFDIKDYVFERKVLCPVCDRDFFTHTLRSGKMVPIATDYDLRPIFKEPIQPMFYDVISCTHCGYTAVSQKFSTITSKQADLILAEITPKFKAVTYPPLYTLDMAIEKYKLALLNAAVKKARDGEKAYICMRLAWLYRCKKDRDAEQTFTNMAYIGFHAAFGKDTMPICGLDEYKVSYLMAAFAKALGQYEASLKLLSTLITNRSVPSRIKERAIDLKDTIRQILKDQEQQGVCNTSLR